MKLVCCRVVKGDQLLIMDVSEADKGIYMCRVDLQCSVVVSIKLSEFIR